VSRFIHNLFNRFFFLLLIRDEQVLYLVASDRVAQDLAFGLLFCHVGVQVIGEHRVSVGDTVSKVNLFWPSWEIVDERDRIQVVVVISCILILDVANISARPLPRWQLVTLLFWDIQSQDSHPKLIERLWFVKIDYVHFYGCPLFKTGFYLEIKPLGMAICVQVVL